MRAPLFIAIFALAACSDAYPPLTGTSGDLALPRVEVAAADMQVAPSPPPTSPTEAETANPAAESFLAYSYSYGFTLPAAAVKPVADTHMRRCIAAGPQRCQVLGSSSQNYSEDQVSATLSLRAAPDHLDGFMASARDEVDAADGRLETSSVATEDLTRQIIDTDARLTAQTTLRDRLQALLETRDGELADLLAVERELARVQGEIEAATSTLAALRKRVEMSRVDITYGSRRAVATGSAVSPVGEALRDFVRTLSWGLASVIRFIAAVLPWLVFVGLPLALLLRWFLRRRRRVAPAKLPSR